MRTNQLVTFAVCSVVAFAAGCGARTDNAAVTLTIAAASDLQDAFGGIGPLFEERAGCRVAVTFGSTGQLAQQIEHGAPFDVFAAANAAYMRQLADKKRVVADSVALYARGRIVLITNKRSEATAVRLEDLLAESIKHVSIANPSHAPYGQAAKQALEHRGLWDKLQSKLVMGENVRQALQYVQTANAEAGIVARSVADLPNITSTLIDSSWHQPLDQAIAVVADSKNAALARRFVDFVVGTEGQEVLAKHGFEKPVKR
jgi:molybdate transport system substrate-binding protein